MCIAIEKQLSTPNVLSHIIAIYLADFIMAFMRFYMKEYIYLAIIQPTLHSNAWKGNMEFPTNKTN